MDRDKLEKLKPWIRRIAIAFALFLCALYVLNAYYPFFNLSREFSIFTILYFPMLIIGFIASIFSIPVMYVSPWQIYLVYLLLFSGQIIVYIWAGEQIENLLEKRLHKKASPPSDK